MCRDTCTSQYSAMNSHYTGSPYHVHVFLLHHVYPSDSTRQLPTQEGADVSLCVSAGEDVEIRSERKSSLEPAPILLDEVEIDRTD